VILKDEDPNPNVSLDEIANMTDGFSGSDLKKFMYSCCISTG